MKQICPSCLKNVEVPETAAGTDYPCLVCGSMIPVPKNYSPSVAVPPPPAPADRPPPPPGLAPPTGATVPPAPPLPVGDAKEIGISIPPKLLDWLPVIGLTAIFVLTFFTWVGSYPGGHRLFAQNAWDGLGRYFTPNNVPADLEDVEKKLEKEMPTTWLMLPYLALLVATLFLAVADRVLPHEVNPLTLPGPLIALTRIWPMRHGLLMVGCLALLGLFLIQGWKGFGLDNALQGFATAKYEDEAKAADTDLKKTAAKVRTGQEYARFAVHTTTGYALAFWLHVIVALAMFLHVRSPGRAGRPAPRLALRY